MKAEEQAKKIYWALMRAAEQGEEMKIELTIIENGLKEYAQSQLEKEREDKRELLIKYDRFLEDGVPIRVSESLVDEFLTQTKDES